LEHEKEQIIKKLEIFDEPDSRHFFNEILEEYERRLVDLKKEERELIDSVKTKEVKLNKMENELKRNKVNSLDYTDLTKEFSDMMTNKERLENLNSKAKEKNSALLSQIDELKSIYSEIHVKVSSK